MLNWIKQQPSKLSSVGSSPAERTILLTFSLKAKQRSHKAHSIGSSPIRSKFNVIEAGRLAQWLITAEKRGRTSGDDHI